VSSGSRAEEARRAEEVKFLETLATESAGLEISRAVLGRAKAALLERDLEAERRALEDMADSKKKGWG